MGGRGSRHSRAGRHPTVWPSTTRGAVGERPGKAGATRKDAGPRGGSEISSGSETRIRRSWRGEEHDTHAGRIEERGRRYRRSPGGRNLARRARTARPGAPNAFHLSDASTSNWVAAAFRNLPWPTTRKRWPGTGHRHGTRTCLIDRQRMTSTAGRNSIKINTIDNITINNNNKNRRRPTFQGRAQHQRQYQHRHHQHHKQQ